MWLASLYFRFESASFMQELKSSLRKAALARRDAVPEIDRIEMSLAAAEHGARHPILAESFIPGSVVSGFHPIRSEIDPRPLMAELAKRGARLCLPMVTDKTTIEFRELVRGAPMVDGGFGTVGPDKNAAVLDPEILLVPLSVFDGQGGRVGYGAGFYDRAIEKLIAKGIAPRLLGMAFSLQQVDTVPMEAHDRFLESVITETGIVSA